MIEQIADYIRTQIGRNLPETAIILGSGLGGLGDEIEKPVYINYKDIPGFPHSTVAGHKGRLIIGRLEGKMVLCMQGRVHLYEGHDPASIKLIIDVFHQLGIKKLIVTNAAGSLKLDMPPGSIMLIKDHINFSGRNPLVGPNDEKYGPRFPVMNDAYTPAFREKIKQIAKENDIPLHEGVYLMVLGPNFETVAEIKAFRILGADAVGMSTVPEVICAARSGIKVLGLSVITNYGTGMNEQIHDHAQTLHQADMAAANLTKLVKGFIKED